MGLELHLEKSKWWYGRVTVNGRKLNKNLGVEVRGTPPGSLSQAGDLPFERSRAKAQAALDRLQSEIKRRGTAEELIQTIHEIRTGARVTSIPMADAAARWQALPRRRRLSPRYAVQGSGWMERFVEFLREHQPFVREMHQVQPAMARAFVAAEERRGVSPKTYNNCLIFLRSSFEALKEEGGLAKNPFTGIPTKEEETIFRKPFSADDLAAIVEAAKEDRFTYPIVVTGMCTAMRRGDCCVLPKSAVDLPNRFIRVKTSKTGELVQIPIFPLLQEVLEKAELDDSPYMFPQQALKFLAYPDFFTTRVRRIMKAAGFFDPEDAKSDDERKAARGEIHQDRPNGLRKASVRDFHSFRVTWVTLALTAGVPLEIVKKVTGHRTAEIVMKHYFQPGREEFRRTLATKLPTLLSGAPAAKPIDSTEVAAKLKSMNFENWEQVRHELLTRLPQGGEVIEFTSA